MRNNLNGSKIYVAVNKAPPFISANYKPNTTKLFSLEGYEGAIVNTLSQYLNFSFEIVDCGMVWGNKVNGSWDGLIGAVYHNRVNMSIGGITMTSERAADVLFSYPHFINSVTFSTPIPQKIGYSSSLLGPFETRIWIFLLTFLLVMFTFCLLTERLIENIPNIQLNIIQIILSQAIDSFKSRLHSMRILILSWLLSAFVIKNYYCGDLFGLMTITDFDKIETLDDFVSALKSNEMKVLIPGNNSQLYLTEIKGLELRGDKGLRFRRSAASFKEFLMILKNEPKKYSTIQDRMSLQYVLSMMNIAQTLPPTNKDSNVYQEFQAIILQKDSVFEVNINLCISLMKESGLINFWSSRYVTDKRFNTIEGREDKFDGLNFDQIFYAFKTVIFGICSAIVVLISECGYSRFSNSPKAITCPKITCPKFTFPKITCSKLVSEKVKIFEPNPSRLSKLKTQCRPRHARVSLQGNPPNPPD